MLQTRYLWIAALLSMSATAPAFAQDEASAEATVDGTTVEATAETTEGGAVEGDVAVEEAGGGQSVAYSTRRLTLPKGTLRVDFAPADRAMLNNGLGLGGGAPVCVTLPIVGTICGGGGGGASSTGISLTDGADMGISAYIGAGFGVIENLEVGAILLPLNLAPSGVDTFGDISLYGRYQFVDGDTQVAGQLTLQVPTATDFGIGLGLPVKFGIGENAALNTGLRLSMVFADPDMIMGLNIPVELAFNVSPNLYFGGFTGFNADLQPTTFESLHIPLGVFGGYTLDLGNKMLLDVTAQFGFPNFLSITKAKGDDAIVTDGWQIVFGATFHIGLM